MESSIADVGQDFGASSIERRAGVTEPDLSIAYVLLRRQVQVVVLNES